jgi:hypothetical protein
MINRYSYHRAHVACGKIENVCFIVIACDKREAFAQGSRCDEAIDSFLLLNHGLPRLRSQ